MLSVMRIMTGLLLLQHGLNKVFDFPVRPNHRPFELFTLVPGAAGTLELLGGLLIAVGLFSRPVAFVLAGEMAFAYFLAHAARSFFPLVNVVILQFSSALCSCTCSSQAGASGA